MKMQYEISGESFFPCGSTTPRMEAGFYDIIGVPGRGYGLQIKRPVTDELIDLKGTVADEVFADMQGFLATKAQYARYGLTHKRGYLFFGPPGSGKTCLGQMLARRFIEGVDGIVMNCTNINEFVNAVDIMRKVEPGRPSMYLLEESESMLNNVHCLSILDGEQSLQGSVFVAMTNYKEEMPPRLANRPGRFDMVVKVDCPPPEVQIEYLRRVEARGGENTDLPQRIVKSLEGISLSLAHLREAFISHVLLNISLDVLRDRFEKMAGKSSSTAGATVIHMDDKLDEPGSDGNMFDDDDDLDYSEPDTDGYND